MRFGLSSLAVVLVACEPEPEPEPPEVSFSEVLPTNLNAPEGLLTWEGLRSDWFELHTASSDPVVLDGVGLAGSPESPAFWAFPEGVVLEGHGHLLVFADDAPSRDAELHAPVQLAESGSLTLVAVDGTVLDTVVWPQIRADHSWAVTDGGWFEDATPTPLAVNE